jgi:amino acid adenylation domain-containing protein
LAHYLISRGLKKGNFVGVLIERSFESIISLLAIMKAGGVYVPFDPSIPENRLEYMIEDSRPVFILTLASQTIGDFHDVQLIHLDVLADKISRFSNENPEITITSNDLCYMIYTSGSTGQPKGAMNKHSALTNNFLWMQKTYGLNSKDATLHKSPCNFDASILEIFLALQCCAKIVIAEPDGHKSTHYQLAEIKKHNVTFIFSVPSVLNIMLDEIGEQQNTSLRLILVGGEQFSMHLYDKLRNRFPQVSVCNLYGPAEAAIEVTAFDCHQEFEGESVPIGKPIANVETFVVDDNMNLVEPGTPGELIIYGIAIGSGYFGKKELTDDMFIDHPFLEKNEYKAYRTGDIVRQLSDGNLVFLGRKDNQIKISGVRIELGEIEYHLQSIPWIDQAVVVGKAISSKQSNNQMTLVAYYSSNDSNDSSRNKEIRLILRDKLPGYMVPSIFIEINKFPLNASGKVDRLNLPSPNVKPIGPNMGVCS